MERVKRSPRCWRESVEMGYWEISHEGLHLDHPGKRQGFRRGMSAVWIHKWLLTKAQHPDFRSQTSRLGQVSLRA